MTISPDEAGALLRDISSSERRTREMLITTRAGDYMILWGVLWAIGYILTYWMGNRAVLIWSAVDVVGLSGSFLITYRTTRNLDAAVSRSLLWRPLAGSVVLIGFGVFCVWLARLGPREQGAFWPTFQGTVLFVFGLWGGRVFCVVAALIIAPTLGGYFWSGTWFVLWLAFVCSSTLVALGLWLRR